MADETQSMQYTLSGFTNRKYFSGEFMMQSCPSLPLGFATYLTFNQENLCSLLKVFAPLNVFAKHIYQLKALCRHSSQVTIHQGEFHWFWWLFCLTVLCMYIPAMVFLQNYKFKLVSSYYKTMSHTLNNITI